LTFEIEKVNGKIPVAITIAGSDSGGGAGIQADLKTFAALGVHGTTAVTSVTAQNTCSLIDKEDVDTEIVKKQIRAVADDIGVDAAKTGMLHTKEIVNAVAAAISSYDFPLVVDPVMIASSGANLLESDAVDALKKRIIKNATVVTPNRFEAEKLGKIIIRNVEDAKVAAERISMIGSEAVVVKGSHIDEEHAVDVLYHKGRFRVFKAPKLDAKTTHGTGCSFSAAITAELAKGKDISEAVENAKRIVALAIRFGLDLGKGYGPVNPVAGLYRESSRYQVLLNVEKARRLLESSSLMSKLIPEVGMNIAMAVPYAEKVGDVAAIPGRLVKVSNRARSVAHARFGGSSHLARYIIEIMKHDPRRKAAVNLRFSEETLEVLKGMNLEVSFYDREKEPEEVKSAEGMSVQWGVTQAVKREGKVPDVIYHMGDFGKEPMIVILCEEASELAELVLEIAVKVGRS
jgi:hydroxymethylpyrimidine kinase/phosphomethylpyrimidine kinase